jgi:hypothetical protein
VILKLAWTMLCLVDAEALLHNRAREDVLNRRRYLLDEAVGGGAGVQAMPAFLGAQFRGEWAVGTYSMLASALTNVAFRFPETRAESLTAVSRLIADTLDQSMRKFDTERWREDALQSLDSPRGHIGYLGHLAWMIGAHRFLGGDRRFEETFTRIGEALSRRLLARPGHCLETYPGEAYLPDNVVVYAALRNYDRLHGTSLATPVDHWVVFARARLLDEEGLLPFNLDDRCHRVGVSRGSGAGWNSFYLPFIDARLAHDQFAALVAHRRARRVVAGILEYPRGQAGRGDVDSGPVVLGLSPSGTGFALAGAVHRGDTGLLSELLFTSELVGSTVDLRGRRRYLLAPLVGDAILLAMKTAIVWDDRYVAWK